MVELEFMESDAWPCHVQRQSASVLAEPLENRLRCMYIYIFIIIYIYIRKLAEDLLILAPGLTHLTLRASFLNYQFCTSAFSIAEATLEDTVSTPRLRSEEKQHRVNTS